MKKSMFFQLSAAVMALFCLVSCSKGAVSSVGSTAMLDASSQVSDEESSSFLLESSSQPVSSADSSKAASSKTTSKKPASPASKPNQPAGPVWLEGINMYYRYTNDAWIIDSAGNRYTFTGAKRPYQYESKLFPLSGKYEYATMKKVDTNVKGDLTAVGYNGISYRLERNGTLYVKGTLPTKDAQEHRTTDGGTFLKQNTIEQKDWKPLLKNVKNVINGVILTNNGDVYVYGHDYFYSLLGDDVYYTYKSPKKVLSGIASVLPNSNILSIQAITNKGEWIVAGITDDYLAGKKDGGSKYLHLDDITVVAKDVRSVGVWENNYCYISKKDELYLLGYFESPEKESSLNIYTPKKIADHVKEAMVTYWGFSYLTTDNKSYIGGNNNDRCIKDSDEPFVETPYLVAKDIKAFSYVSGVLFYIDSKNQLHSYGKDTYDMRGISSDKKVNMKGYEDTVILKNVRSVFSNRSWVCAQQFDGSIYCWGRNVISCRPVGEKNPYFNLNNIPEPVKVN